MDHFAPQQYPLSVRKRYVIHMRDGVMYSCSSSTAWQAKYRDLCAQGLEDNILAVDIATFPSTRYPPERTTVAEGPTPPVPPVRTTAQTMARQLTKLHSELAASWLRLRTLRERAQYIHGKVESHLRNADHTVKVCWKPI